LCALLLSLAAMPGLAATYQFEPGRTFPQFEIDHLWFYTQRGRFDLAHGTLEYDAALRTGRLDITIDARSLDTGNDERDTDLRGARWFDVSRYPTITFRSRRFVFGQDRLTAIEGELTMRGVTRPMTLEISRIACGPDAVSGKRACAADARGSLRRSRFGMRSSLPFIGDEVRLRIQAEAYLDTAVENGAGAASE
jgi:polyisoprenoid-binding protein YceI